jgi:hypothetical protein
LQGISLVREVVRSLQILADFRFARAAILLPNERYDEQAKAKVTAVAAVHDLPQTALGGKTPISIEEGSQKAVQTTQNLMHTMRVHHLPRLRYCQSLRVSLHAPRIRLAFDYGNQKYVIG